MRKIIYPFLWLWSRICPRFRRNIFDPELYRLPRGMMFANFLFQRVLRVNGCFESSLHFTSRVINPEKMKYCHDQITLISFAASSNCYIQAINGIEIGKDFMFAPGLKMISSNHDPDKHASDLQTNPIKIGNNVWTGVDVIILPGVSIADNCTIGAGAVVTKSILVPGSVAVGNPAKVIR